MAGEEPEVAYLCGTMIGFLARLCAPTRSPRRRTSSPSTNDLTQTALGVLARRRRGSSTFYLEHGILERNPFEVLDVDGVGDLMRIAVERGRATKPAIKLGICGEHGGEPRSVAFCHEPRARLRVLLAVQVPLARLAAAQAALAEVGVTALAIGG